MLMLGTGRFERALVGGGFSCVTTHVEDEAAAIAAQAALFAKDPSRLLILTPRCRTVVLTLLKP